MILRDVWITVVCGVVWVMILRAVWMAESSCLTVPPVVGVGGSGWQPAVVRTTWKRIVYRTVQRMVDGT